MPVAVANPTFRNAEVFLIRKSEGVWSITGGTIANGLRFALLYSRRTADNAGVRSPGHPRRYLFGCQKYQCVPNCQNLMPMLLMEPATQLSVFLSNRPGALARVCDALAKAEINIHALATSDTVDHSVVRMVVSDPTRALMLLGEAGVLALENDVLMIQSDNHPGTLSKIAERLSQAGVNIEYAYMAALINADKGLMILRPNDVDQALRALRDL